MKRRLGALALAMSLMLLSVQPAMAIVYGEEDTTDTYKNVGALIVVDGPNRYPVCSGALIRDGDGGGSDDGLFLTAAHCIVILPRDKDGELENVYITFAKDLNNGPDHLVAEGVPHPRFNQRQSNPYDIGILTFDAKTNIAPASLANVGDFTKKQLRKSRFVTAGYGVTREDKKKAWQNIDWENTLRYWAEQSMTSVQKAWLTLAMNSRAVENGGTCYGDSGGPHFHKGTKDIVSITVTGDRFCKALDRTYRVDTPWVQTWLSTEFGY